MTPEICLISVPHNGTMFAREIFVSQGWSDTTLNGRPTDMPALYQGHCEKLSQCMHAIDLSHRMPVIMPLRHPYRVEESWRRRHEDLTRMLAAYAHLLDYLHPCISVWLPLDAAGHIRRKAHQQLDAMAGKELHIGWITVVNGQHNTHDVPLSDLDPSDEIRDILRHPLFASFYGEEERHAQSTKQACA